MRFEQRERIVNLFITSHFSYCPLVWMFHSRRLNICIDHINERALRIIYQDYNIYQMSFCILKDLIDRSSHRKCSVRKGVLRNFAKFTEKHLCPGLFFNKVVGFSLSKNTFSQNTSGWLLLYWNLTDYMLSERLKNTSKTLWFVYYSNRTPYLKLHSPTKNLLTNIPHKYKKELYYISIL